MTKNQLLISVSDLTEFMDEEKYSKFIGSLAERAKKSDDSDYNDEPIWIIAEW